MGVGAGTGDENVFLNTSTLRVAYSIYLVQLAVTLWPSSGQEIQDSHPITVRRVFFNTLMNPKNLIFAFGIFPIPSVGAGELLPYLAGFSVICTVVAGG